MLIDRGLLPDINGLQVSIDGDGLLASHNFDICLTNHVNKLDNGTVALEQSCSYGFTSYGNAQPLYFAVRLLKYRTGKVGFHFRWDELLRGTIFEEEYDTSLRIQVDGPAPPSVVSIAPHGPFRKTGGQLIDCTVINSAPNQTYYLTVGNTTLSATGRKTSPEGWMVVSFVSPLGEGNNVSWDLAYVIKDSKSRTSCFWAGEGDRYVFNYFDEDIALSSLSPNYGPVVGGVDISCSGYFGNFSLSGDSGDAIMLGSYVLEKEYIISVTATTIVFKLPPMQVVQSPTFDITCVVIVHGIRSNELLFAYESLTDVSISLTGGSFEEKMGTYMIPICNSTGSTPADMSVTFFAAVNKGAPMSRLTFQWRVVAFESRSEVFALSGKSEAQSLVLGISRLFIREQYEVLVKISDSRYATQITVSMRVQATSARMLGVGLSLDQTRTLSLPQVESRFTAYVSELGDCFNKSKRLSYDWTFLSTTKTLTATSKTVDIKNPSPRRLGREYVIPRSALRYGKHKVGVKVFYTDDPDTYGIAYSWLNVEPAILQAKIGSGESLIRVTDSSDLEMTGGSSYDPDGSFESLTYRWQCELSIEGNEKFTSVTSCPSTMLPYSDKEKFSVSSSVLRSIGFIKSKTYMRYSLFVRKSYKGIGERSSSVASQVVEITSSEETVATRGRIRISNLDGHPVMLNNVPFYEALILSPHGPAGTAWRFKLLEPASEAFTFLKNPNNVLSQPGFYSTTSFIAGRNALGIRANALQPNSQYKFSVQYESTTADNPSMVEVNVRTMAQPVVTFLRPGRQKGTRETVFTLIAESSIESYAFKYYFYISLRDGEEMCIDGCSGMRKVSFQVSAVGTYSVRCEMVDARGGIVVDAAKQRYNLTIVDEDWDSGDVEVMRQSEMLGEMFDLGDHSGFELEALRLAWYAQTVGTKDGMGMDVVGELVGKTVGKLAELFGKSQPNTALARDYMRITVAFAVIPGGNAGLWDRESFYAVCRMLQFAVMNTGNGERFDMLGLVVEAIGELHRYAGMGDGTSRQRLAGGNSRNEVNEELLEIFEMAVPLLVGVGSRGAGCGMQRVISVEGMLKIWVGVYCSMEQAEMVRGRYTSLGMCKRVFDGEKRVVFGLAEMKDYIGESGVLKMRKNEGKEDVVVEKGAVLLDTRRMRNHGFVIVKTIVAEADSMKGVNEGEGCFSVVQQVQTTNEIFPDYEEVRCETEGGVVYVGMKKFGKNVEDGMYGENKLKSVTMRKRDNRLEEDEQVVQVGVRMGNVDGKTFGVKRGRCLDLQPHVVGIGVGIGIIVVTMIGVIIGVGVLGMIGIRRQIVLAERKLFVEGNDEPYIERDTYGRDQATLQLGNLQVIENNDDQQVVFQSPRNVGQLFALDNS